MKKILIILGVFLLITSNVYPSIINGPNGIIRTQQEKNLNTDLVNKLENSHHHVFEYKGETELRIKCIKGKKLIKGNDYYLDEYGISSYSYDNINPNKNYIVKVYNYKEECRYCDSVRKETRSKILREATSEDLKKIDNEKWYQTYNFYEEKYEVSEWVIAVSIVLGIFLILGIIGIISYFGGM